LKGGLEKKIKITSPLIPLLEEREMQQVKEW
jgi:hypothetical protein